MVSTWIWLKRPIQCIYTKLCEITESTNVLKCRGYFFYTRFNFRDFCILSTKYYMANPSGRAVQGVGLWPLACWDCRFESRRVMDVSYDCCVFSGIRVGLCVGLITRPESPTECGVSDCDHLTSTTSRTWPTRGCRAMEKNILFAFFIVLGTKAMDYFPIQHSLVFFCSRDLCMFTARNEMI
jgi:hypothetical protein